MKTTKRLISIVLVAVICLLSGCGSYNNLRDAETIVSNERYDVLRKDDQYYFVPRNWKSSSGASSLVIADWPQFSSIGEMKETILSGNCPYSRTIAMKAAQNNGTIPIYPLDRLYEALIPVGGISDLLWELEGYSFGIEGEYRGSVLSGRMRIMQAQQFEISLKSKFTDKFEELTGRKEILLHETDPQTNAEVLCYKKNSGGHNTLVHKTYQLQDKTLYVSELWLGNSPYVQSKDHESQPGRISRLYIWGEQNGGCFYFFVSFSTPLYANHVPTEVWIQSIGLKPYVEDETE